MHLYLVRETAVAVGQTVVDQLAVHRAADHQASWGIMVEAFGAGKSFQTRRNH